MGLSYRDVYGIINAGTTWIPRIGAADGTPNLGIAQFESATAKDDGPPDPVQAVHAAALHLKDAAKWSARRIADLKLSLEQRAVKLREGVSIYYNLSTKGRKPGTASTPLAAGGDAPPYRQCPPRRARRRARAAAPAEGPRRPACMLTVHPPPPEQGQLSPEW